MDWMASSKKDQREAGQVKQWFEICMMASSEKPASEDNTGIDSVQRWLVTQWKKTEHTLNTVKNNGMLRKAAKDMLEGRGTTKRDLDRLEEWKNRNIVNLMTEIEWFNWKGPKMNN